MYILTIGRSYPEKKTGMIGIFEYQQASILSDIGHKVVYAFSDNRSVKVIRSVNSIRKTDKNIKIYGRQLPIGGLPKPLFNKIKTEELKKLINLIISENEIPEIVHIHFPLLSVTEEFIKYLKSLGCKIVCTEHWSAVQTKKINSRYTNFLKYLTKNSDAFICVNDTLKKSVIELTETKKDIYVVPNTVSEDFKFKNNKTNSEKFRFIAVGRLVPIKKFDIIISAFAKEFKDEKNVFLNIAGDGKCRKSLEKQIKNLGLQKRVRLYGFKESNELAVMYANSNCYVSASILETFGVPIIEAWTMGLPCICSENLPIANYFNSENGVLTKQNTVSSFAEAMRKVYENKNVYNKKKISDEAKKFSPETIAKELTDIFKSI